MPTVTVRIHALLSERLGLAEGGKRAILEQAIAPGESIRDVLSRLGEQYPAFRENVDPVTGRLVGHLLVVVDGHLLTAPGDYDKPLSEGARIELMPAYAGG